MVSAGVVLEEDVAGADMGEDGWDGNSFEDATNVVVARKHVVMIFFMENLSDRSLSLSFLGASRFVQREYARSAKITQTQTWSTQTCYKEHIDAHV